MHVRYFHSTRELYGCYYTLPKNLVLNPLFGQLCGSTLSLLINRTSKRLPEKTTFYLSLHEKLLFSLSSVYTYPYWTAFRSHAVCFPKVFKKVLPVCAGKRQGSSRPAAPNIGLHDADQMEQTASIQTDKKGILLASPVGTAWDTSILWAHENWLTAGCDREEKNSLTNVVPWKCSSLQKDKKESGSCGCPSWGVQQEQASSGYAASWPGMMAKHWGSARSWLSQDWRGAGKDVLAQRQDGCGSGSLAQSPVVICWGWGKRSPMSAQLLSELLSVCLSSQHSSAWEEGEELLFDRISFVLFCNPSNRMETDNVQFVLIQLYLVSPSYNTAANIILKNRDVMEEGEILQTLLITSQVITINIWRREKLLI